MKDQGIDVPPKELPLLPVPLSVSLIAAGPEQNKDLNSVATKEYISTTTLVEAVTTPHCKSSEDS